VSLGWARTDTGKIRLDNEDAFWFGGEKDWYLALVADGMGGHQAGHIASQLATGIIRSHVKARLKNKAAAAGVLQEAVQNANSEIFVHAQNDRGLSGMGTTVTALFLHGGIAEIAHVGDSRAYLFRQKKLRQLTNDHSLVQELVDAGSISPAQARRHPQRHLLTRVLGTSASISVDKICSRIQPGDLFLLCTDGLTGELTDDKIETVLRSYRPATAVEQLVRQALRMGGHDNITALLVQVGDKL